MQLIDALLTAWSVLFPIILFVVPGVLIFFSGGHETGTGRAARMVLGSYSAVSLASYVAAYVHAPIVGVYVAVIALTAYALWRWRRRLAFHELHWQLLVLGAVGMLLFAAFSLPFLIFHDGLPTGDSQKALIFGQYVAETNRLPAYHDAIALLNRDPVDFYTPALHSVVGLTIKFAADPLLAIGLVAIAVSLAGAVVTAALARVLFPSAPPAALVIATVWWLLSNERYLRYLREPGYHFQNAVGEFLFLGVLLLSLSLLERWRKLDGLMLVAILATLVLSHQFSAFLAGLILLPIIGVALSRHYHRVRWTHAVPLAVGLAVLVIAAFSLGLQEKIPHIFTSTPHLIELVPAWHEYPRLMGLKWLGFGLGGLGLAVWHLRGTRYGAPPVGFVLACAVLLLLTQGPRIFIDIPPVRTLFYLVGPLSITAGYLTVKAFEKLWVGRATRGAAWLLAIVVMLAGASSSARAFDLTHGVRTNSTLLPSQLQISRHLTSAARTGAVLIDDYNQRSSSWLVLAGHPMYTRIAADLRRHMAEASQSELREQLYHNQLDFEKIYSLGSRPEIASLLEKHNIGWVAGIASSSATAFAGNPVLTEAANAGTLSVFALKPRAESQCRSVPARFIPWLLKTHTLANDIGDDEDTFEHLPVSLRATRLSDPLTTGSCTYRTTSAPYIRLHFNVADYVAWQWDQTNTQAPDTALELLLTFTERPPELYVITPRGPRVAVPQLPGLLRLEMQAVPLGEDGKLDLILENPSQAPVAIDLVALGPARVP